MLLQTNSYIVPKEKRAEHSRLIRRFRQTLLRLGCDHFEVYEQVGSNWSNSESAGRYVQILRFLDRKHQLAVQAAERSDPTAQAVIADFCDLINFPYQQQQGLFAVGFYTSVLPVAPKRGARGELVSTVEHEVIDDPEAEAPYPGASDGPPLEEAAGDTGAEPAMAGEEPMVVEEPLVGGEPAVASAEPPVVHAFESVEAEVLEHHEPVTEPIEAQPAKPDIQSLIEHIPDEPLVTQVEEPAAKDADDFMSLVGGELDSEVKGAREAEFENPFDEESDDDAAHGFIEAEVVDDVNGQPHNGGAEPAHQHSKERPPGW
jgi:hypothetical protein